MKVLYFTDTHFRSATPLVRRDCYAATMKAKLLEIVSLANSLDVAGVLHGGDLFDYPCPSWDEAAEFLAPLSTLRAPLFLVAGNHDLFAYDPNTLDYTIVGFLARIGFLRLLSTAQPLFLDDGHRRVKLTGTPFHHTIDQRDPRLDYCTTKEDCDFAVHLTHGMLLENPLTNGTPFTLIKDIAHFTEADVTLGSHAHFGFPDLEIDGKLFINPGSVARLSAHPIDLKRQPQVVILDFSAEVPTAERAYLTSARPGKEVIADGWRESYVSCRVKAGVIDDVLAVQARKDNSGPEVLREAQHLLTLARQGEVQSQD